MDTEVSIAGVDFHPDGDRLVTLTCPFGEPDAPTCPATLTVWDVESGRSLAGPVAAGDVWPGLYQGAAFTGDGEYIVTAGDADGIVLWDADALEPVGEPFSLDEVSTMTDEVVRVLDTASVDGRSLVVGGGELGGAAVWDVTGGDVTALGAFGGNSSVQFTARGPTHQRLRTGHLPVPRPVHPRATRDPVRHQPAVALVRHLRHRPARRQRAVGQPAVGHRHPPADLRDLASTMSALAPDGSTVYLGGWGLPGEASGSVVQAIDLRPDALATLACERAGRNMTADEWDAYMPADEPTARRARNGPASNDEIRRTP
jgi:hypothetical protein